MRRGARAATLLVACVAAATCAAPAEAHYMWAAWRGDSSGPIAALTFSETAGAEGLPAMLKMVMNKTKLSVSTPAPGGDHKAVTTHPPLALRGGALETAPLSPMNPPVALRGELVFGVFPEIDPHDPPLLRYAFTAPRVSTQRDWAFIDSTGVGGLDVTIRTAHCDDSGDVVVVTRFDGENIGNVTVQLCAGEDGALIREVTTDSRGVVKTTLDANARVFGKASHREHASGVTPSGDTYNNVAHYATTDAVVGYSSCVPHHIGGGGASKADAETARWLVAGSNWGVVTINLPEKLGGDPFTNVMSVSDGVAGNSTGRVFFYMSAMDETGAALLQNPDSSVTFCEAQILGANTTCDQLDPEDPTCAKLTITGSIIQLADGSPDQEFALKALFDRHPDMEKWPTGHGWLTLEMKPTQLFFLDFYGGAKDISVEDYYAAVPKHNVPSLAEKRSGAGAKRSAAAPRRAGTIAGETKKGAVSLVASSRPVSRIPPWFEKARVARYLVHAADWGVVGTRSVHLDGQPFGNVASFSDGAEDDSTGRLFFYLTKMDPTATDAAAHANVSFSLTEAMLQSGKGGSENVCKQLSAEDPTCARITLSGSLAPAADQDLAKKALFARHPDMASWPAGHDFAAYELTIKTIFFLDMYGGTEPMKVADYFAAKP